MRLRILGTWLFVSICVRAQPMMLMSPYLQAVTKTSIEVLVESRSTDSVTVYYGRGHHCTDSARTSRIDQTDLPSYVHTVKLDGLLPNTLYEYRVRQGHEAAPVASFRTAAEPGTPFRFAWMADCRTGTGVHDTIAERISLVKPAVLLYGGDIASTSSYEAFKKDFFRPAELALISSVPFFNSVGNHEGWTTNTRAFTRGLPSSSGTEEYYSFDYGDLHVVVLNTQLPYGPGSPQYQFAERDLSSSSSAWKIVIAHKPAYCGGGHGEDAAMKEMTAKIFEPNHVVMVIAGHSHFYQHNVVNGIHHMVIGSAGAGLYTPESEWYTVAMAKAHNYAIGDVSPTMLRLVVYDERGNVLDSLSLHQQRPAPPAQARPDHGMGSLFREPVGSGVAVEPVSSRHRARDTRTF